MSDDAIERTAARFVGAAKPSHFARRSTYYYVVSKLRRDPASHAIAALAPLGDVLDIGCGRGHLALWLLESNRARSVRAFDWDEEKVALARRASAGLDADFEARDARTSLDGALDADTVLLVDVLHYVDATAQDEILAWAADRVRPGGRLVLREASTGHGWRSLFTILVERISKLVRVNLGDRIAVRDVAKDYVPILEAHGLACTVTPCWAGTPFANVLLVATRPGAAIPV